MAHRFASLAGSILGLLLTACASHPPPPTIAEAVGADPVSGLSVSCNRPVKLTRDCSGWSGADRSIFLDGREIRIAGSDDGRNVLVMPPGLTGAARGGPGLVTQQTNLRTESVKATLATQEIQVVSATPIVTYGALYGYLLELDGDGYTLLARLPPPPEAGVPTVVAEDPARWTNVRDSDGTLGFAHFRRRDMPIVVALPRPPRSPHDGSTEEARDTMIAAIRTWETVLADRAPWVEFEISERPQGPDVEVEWLFERWSRKYFRRDVSVEPPAPKPRITIPMGAPSSIGFTLAWLYDSMLYGTGYALGLRNENEDDSAMNFHWLETHRVRQTAAPTSLDVDRFCALQAQPAGFRIDGVPLRSLTERGWLPPSLLELAEPCL